ncbi:prolipoprotein diacylglyceryl transferase family protein [Massilia niabensis]|uniref:Prolipoprotein diacylglyceryl transferase family protein n=1 Tax=Massilia niabensis TaxID=544910 RepID=A0ABW0LDG4_9BURK
MDAINLGPLALPVRVVAPLLAMAAASVAGAWWTRRRAVDPSNTLWHMALWGLLAARAAFVLKHFDTYLADPLDILDIRDGGFVAFAGLLVALAIGADAARRERALQRPLATSVLAGIAVWAGATLAFGSLAAPAPLPDLALRRLDGSLLSLRGSGKPVVVNLWATWCPPCRREMPALGAAQAANPGVAFVFVNQGEEAAVVQRYLDDERIALNNVTLDPARQVARATQAVGYPTTLFYDAEGRLVARHMGELSRAQLNEQLGALGLRR